MFSLLRLFGVFEEIVAFASLLDEVGRVKNEEMDRLAGVEGIQSILR